MLTCRPASGLLEVSVSVAAGDQTHHPRAFVAMQCLEHDVLPAAAEQVAVVVSG